MEIDKSEKQIASLQTLIVMLELQMLTVTLMARQVPNTFILIHIPCLPSRCSYEQRKKRKLLHSCIMHQLQMPLVSPSIFILNS